MAVVKLSLTEEELGRIKEMMGADVKTANMSVQDFIRYRILGESNPDIFTPEEAARRALEKFTAEDPAFTLPDVYGEEAWALLNPRMTGAFGKRFFNYTKTIESIYFAGMTENGRRATYKIKEGATC